MFAYMCVRMHVNMRVYIQTVSTCMHIHSDTCANYAPRDETFVTEGDTKHLFESFLGYSKDFLWSGWQICMNVFTLCWESTVVILVVIARRIGLDSSLSRRGTWLCARYCSCDVASCWHSPRHGFVEEHAYEEHSDHNDDAWYDGPSQLARIVLRDRREREITKSAWSSCASRRAATSQLPSRGWFFIRELGI